MTKMLTRVPLKSVTVGREIDGRMQIVDPPIGKPFQFTAAEVADFNARAGDDWCEKTRSQIEAEDEAHAAEAGEPVPPKPMTAAEKKAAEKAAKEAAKNAAKEDDL